MVAASATEQYPVHHRDRPNPKRFHRDYPIQHSKKELIIESVPISRPEDVTEQAISSKIQHIIEQTRIVMYPILRIALSLLNTVEPAPQVASLPWTRGGSIARIPFLLVGDQHCITRGALPYQKFP
jgi:hypothetical protein